MYDSNGAETSDSDAAATVVCTITANELLDVFSATSALIVSTGTSATITVATGSEHEQSTPPYSGSYTISMTLEDGTQVQTDELDFYSSTYKIEQAIFKAAPDFRYKVQAGLEYGYWNYNWRRHITLHFVGYNGNPAQFEIARVGSAGDDELVGPDSNTQQTFSSTTK